MRCLYSSEEQEADNLQLGMPLKTRFMFSIIPSVPSGDGKIIQFMTRNLSRFIILIAATLTGLSAAAQVKDISLSAGVNVPIYKDLESDAVINVSYGQFFRNGLGFRAGLQWIPSVADVSNAFGMPVAFAYRTKARTTPERISGAADAMLQDFGYGNEYGYAGAAAAGFLMNLYSDMEYFIGITPGYIAGTSSSGHEAAWGESWQYWETSRTEKKNSFSLMLDAGMTLNYSLWRFDFKLTPAFHYSLTNNYLYHISSGNKDTGATTSRTLPLRWFFTLNGGLAFRF